MVENSGEGNFEFLGSTDLKDLFKNEREKPEFLKITKTHKKVIVTQAITDAT